MRIRRIVAGLSVRMSSEVDIARTAGMTQEKITEPTTSGEASAGRRAQQERGAAGRFRYGASCFKRILRGGECEWIRRCYEAFQEL